MVSYARYIVALILMVMLATSPVQAQEVWRFVASAVSGIPASLFSAPRTCGPHPDSISVEGARFIQHHEGLRTRAYRDVGGYAIGFGMQTWKGRRVTRRYPGRPTVAQIHAEFKRQIVTYENIVRSQVCAPLTQQAFDSLVSIAWNLGRVNTRILDALHQDEEPTPADFLSTATVRGRFNRVLKNRRLAEYAMFVSGNESMEQR